MDALAPPPGAAERDELGGKLNDALKMLRTSRLGRRGAYVYQLPWYAIIGPSGAGKTTALLNSGLDFPTAVAGEYRALRGQPNTPNCDWWFTDEAVLIDTAGRYVTQEAGAKDAEGWRAFLDLLKVHRPLQPLNGIIVAIPAPDFTDPTKMADHAERLRARLREIGQGLGQDLPVYLLVTKADLLPGFREFFARNTDAESAQVFGSTAPGERSDDAGVLVGFDALVTRISGQMVARMQQEPELPRRAEIAAFPAQLASLRQAIATLLGQLGHSSRFEQPARVRGVYLASGTQTGNPVDRILLSAGLPATAPAHGVGSGRSYFLKRLFSDVIIPEQGLANQNAAATKRQRLVYRAGIAASVAALALCLVLWGVGYAKNRRLIAGVYDVAQAYTATGATSGTTTPDVELAALDVLGKAQSDISRASDFGLGLGQGGRLSGEIKAIYGRDLQRRLTPMLASLAGNRIQADMAQPATLYDDLKSYLILGGQGPIAEGHMLAAWVQPAWQAQNAGPDAQVLAADAARHTQALVDFAFKPVAIDGGRVEAARTVIRAQPAAVRVYGRLKSEALAGNDAIWSARDNAGPQPGVFFVEGGALAPGAGVPKLFTRSGYETVFLPALASGPKLLAEERWVVGDVAAQPSLGTGGLPQLKTDLTRLYFDEFLTRWRDYMGAIKPKPATTLQETIQHLRDGSGPLSPIPPLMRAIAAATDMTPGAVGKVGAALPGASLLAAAGVGGPPAGDDPRNAAIAAFAPLRLFVGKAGMPGPLDAVLTTMGQLADKLNMVAVLPGGGGATASQASLDVKAAIGQLEQSGATMPAPAGPWVQAVAGDATAALGGARLSQISGAIGANFGDACRQVLARSFPFQPTQQEVALTDFAKFFSPQGTFANFVTQNLNGYVDTSKPQWEALPNAAEIHITPADVMSFQQAAAVTRAFFANDPSAPRLSYQIEPVALAGAKAVTLTIDGQTLKYDGKTPLPATFDWPGTGGATLSFTGDAPTDARTWPGQWAVFRVMKTAAVRSAGSPTTGTGSLTQGEARFDFKIRSFAGANPFVVDPFAKISCPA